jgi:hypothetical protein
LLCWCVADYSVAVLLQVVAWCMLNGMLLMWSLICITPENIVQFLSVILYSQEKESNGTYAFYVHHNLVLANLQELFLAFQFFIKRCTDRDTILYVTWNSLPTEGRRDLFAMSASSSVDRAKSTKLHICESENYNRKLPFHIGFIKRVVLLRH